MRKKDFSSLLAQICSLNVRQKAQLAEALVASRPKQTPAQLIDEEFSAKPACPSCASKSVYKWGVVSSLQRYRCK
jgi:transposase-like protein